MQASISAARPVGDETGLDLLNQVKELTVRLLEKGETELKLREELEELRHGKQASNSLHVVDYYFIQSRLNDDDLVQLYTGLLSAQASLCLFPILTGNEFSSSGGHIFEVAAHWIMGKGPGDAWAE